MSVEWYNENELRAYPVAETATRTDDAGVRLPDGWLADLSVTVPPGCVDLRLSSITVTATLVSLAISTSTAGLLAGTYARKAIVPYRAVPLVALTRYVAGWVVFGSAVFDVASICSLRFSTAAQSRLDARTVHVIASPGVLRIFKYGGRPDLYLDGNVRLQGNSAIKIERSPEEIDKITLSLDIKDALALSSPCNKEASKNNCKVPPIRMLNGVGPDADGKVTVEFA